jgi:hypothetical protein
MDLIVGPHGHKGLLDVIHGATADRVRHECSRDAWIGAASVGVAGCKG